MAKILYEVKQNKNDKSSAFGKWFAQIKTLETLNTRKLAQHISEHGSIYTPDVVYGVLEKFRSCLLEMLLESKKVKIDGLGTFYTTIESQGAETKEKYNVLTDIKALHIRFLPEQEQEMNISSREFLKKAEFVNIKTLMTGGAEGDESANAPAGGGSTTGGSTGGNTGGNTGGTGGGGDDDGFNQN
jgi:predicted histone-like DNA-binding protein